MTSTMAALHRAWCAADDAWSAQLKKSFGSQAGDARYTKAGEGEEGTALRRAYDGWKVAQAAWDAARRS